MLQAKLCMPHIGRNIVRRKKIEEKLRLLPDYQFAFLSAPAGYGKTTVVADYLMREHIKYAWFSIDEADNDPLRFWNYLTASVAECLGNREFSGLSLDPKLIASNLSVELFIDILEEIGEKCVIVLDDYHLIENSVILNSIEYFVKYMPRNIELILLSRKEPENLLFVQCSRGAAIHLGLSDLSFDSEETAEFWVREGLRLTSEEIKIMDDFTEGWAAGLVAAAFSLRKSESIGDAVRSFSGKDKSIGAILENEVYQRWPEEIKNFLVHTSFLERLSGPLCSTVTGNPKSPELLRLLAESNSFVLSLDSENNWYRYHHLFRKFLMDRLELEDEATRRLLYQRAGTWCLQNEQIRDGINWLLKAGEYEEAFPHIMDRWFEITRDSEFLLWKQWINALPESVYENSNTVFTAYSWILSMENQIDQAELWTVKARDCFERLKDGLEAEQRDYLEAHVLCAEVNVAIWRTDTARIIDRVDLLSRFRLGTPVVLGEMNWDEPNLMKTAYGLRGKLNKIEECLPAMGRLHQFIGSFSAYFAVAFAEFFYERDDLKNLDAVLLHSIGEITDMSYPGLIVPCFIVLAKEKTAQGDIQGAFETISHAGKFLGGKTGSVWRFFLDVFQAKLSLMIGDAEGAAELIDTEKLGLYDPLSAVRESEYIVFARYLMQENKVADALILLSRLENFAQAEERLMSRIEILCLTAICYSRKGNSDGAMHALERALALGEPEGYIRTFVDEREPMAALLKKYCTVNRGEREKHVLYAKKLLRCTGEFAGPLSGTARSIDEVRASENLPASLLTRREAEILQLLAENRSNAEIAGKLYLSVSAVKQYNSRIFDKLRVKNRFEAAAKAAELGLTKP